MTTKATAGHSGFYHCKRCGCVIDGTSWPATATIEHHCPDGEVGTAVAMNRDEFVRIS